MRQIDNEPKEKIFIMIKPWSLHHLDNILVMLDCIGTRIRMSSVREIPLELIAREYADHVGKPYYNPMIEDHAGKPAVIALYKGNQDKFNSSKKIIRERFDKDIPLHPGYKRDVIHSTSNELELVRSLELWGGYFENDG